MHAGKTHTYTHTSPPPPPSEAAYMRFMVLKTATQIDGVGWREGRDMNCLRDKNLSMFVYEPNWALEERKRRREKGQGRGNILGKKK